MSLCAELFRLSRKKGMYDRIDEGSPPIYTVGRGTSAQSGPPFSSVRSVRHAARWCVQLCTFVTEGGIPWGYTRGYSQVGKVGETSAQSALRACYPRREVHLGSVLRNTPEESDRFTTLLDYSGVSHLPGRNNHLISLPFAHSRDVRNPL